MSPTKPSLLSGPVRPALLAFAGPVILSMVATQLYTVADTMIIGLRLDANALAAVSNASTALMVPMFVSGGMELGGGLLLAAADSLRLAGVDAEEALTFASKAFCRAVEGGQEAERPEQ